MAGNDERIDVKFGADASGVKEGSDKAKDAVKQSTDAMNQSFKKMQTETSSALDGIKSHMSTTFGGIETVMSKFKGALAGVAAVVAGGWGTKEAVDKTMEWDKESMKLATTLGITTEAASALVVAGTSVGVTADQISGASKGMTRQLGSNEKVFKDLGIATRDSQGHFRNLTDIMLDTNKVLAGLAEGTDREIAGKKLYGRSWDEVRKIVNITAHEMEEAAKRSDALGLTVGPEAQRQTKEYGKATREMKEVFTAFWKVIGDSVIPLLTKLAEWFNDVGPTAVKVFRGVWNTLMAAIESAVGLFTLFYDVVKGVVLQAVLAMTTFGTVLKKVFTGDMSGAIAAAKSGWADMGLAWKMTLGEMEKDTKDSTERINRLMRFGKDPNKSKPKKGGAHITGDEGKKDEKGDKLDQVSEWKAALEKQKEASSDYFKDARASDIEYWGGKKNLVIGTEEEQKNALAKIGHEIFALKKSMAQDDVAADMEYMKREQENARSSWDERMKYVEAQVDFAANIYGKDSKEYQAALLNQQNMKEKQTRELQKLAEMQVEHARNMELVEMEMDRDQLNYEYEMGIVSAAQKIQIEKRLAEEIYQIKLRSALESANLPGQTPEEHLKRVQAIETLERNHQREMVQLDQQASLESQKRWMTMYDSISGSFGNALKGMIHGTTTFAQAMQNIAESIVDAFLDMGLKITMDWLKNMIFAKVSSVSTAAGEIASNAAVAASAAFASTCMIPMVGPELAPAAATAAYSTVMGMEGLLAGASAAGGYDIPAGINPVVQTHAQEMILPANIANPLRDMIAGGGSAGGHTFHLGFIDTTGAKEFIRRHGSALADAVVKQQRNHKFA